MKKPTGRKLAAFCLEKTKEHSVYMWGEYGRPVSERIISAKAKKYPLRYTEKRQEKLRSLIGKGYVGCDCGGLYKYFLWSDGGRSPLRYRKATDRNAAGMYSAATERGKTSALPEIEGLILYMPNHCGVYVGNGYAVECTLGAFGDGIVKTSVKGRGWTHWLKMPEIDYEEGNTPLILPKKTVDTVAFRSVPSVTGGKRHFYIPEDTLISVIRENVASADGFEWDEVECDGVKGYCANRYLRRVEFAKTKATSDALALRSEPSAVAGERFFYIPRGKEVTVLEENVASSDGYSWDKVVYNETVGYAAKEFLD